MDIVYCTVCVWLRVLVLWCRSCGCKRTVKSFDLSKIRAQIFRHVQIRLKEIRLNLTSFILFLVIMSFFGLHGNVWHKNFSGKFNSFAPPKICLPLHLWCSATKLKQLSLLMLCCVHSFCQSQQHCRHRLFEFVTYNLPHLYASVACRRHTLRCWDNVLRTGAV